MEILIVGAGPAGLSAAVAAREAGATVRLLEASDSTGGQFWRHLPASRPAVKEHVLHHDWDEYVSMRRRLEEDAQVRIDLNAHVWAIEPTDAGLCVDVAHGKPDGRARRMERILPERLVLATGAHDRSLPVPGWTLPGVFTAGAAQAMAKGERVAIGQRVVVAGAGPFLLPVSKSLEQVGARVVAVVEAGSARRLARAWLRRPHELLRLGGKTSELAGYVWHQLRNRIPYRTGRAVVAIHGTAAVEAVTVARLDTNWRPVPGTERRLECDAVCLGHGFVPRLELAVAAGCALDDDRFVVIDEAQRSSVPGVYAAGELTGIGGADLARAEGRIAGWSAADGPIDARSIARARRQRARYRAFGARIPAAHGIGSDWTSWLRDDTVVCRCEEVDHGTLCRVAEATQSGGLRALKLTTRACLGVCQGRVCGRNVEHILADRLTHDAGPGTDRRPIAQPLRLGELAALCDDSPELTTQRKEHHP